MPRSLIAGLAVAAALFHIWAAGVEPFTALVQRPVHLLLMAAIAFLGGTRDGDERPGRQLTAWLWTAAAAAGCLYLVAQHQALVLRAGSATRLDLLAAGLTLVVVLELGRRRVGPGLFGVALAALAYATLGPWLPGVLAHRGYGAARILEHLYLGTEGIWGVPLGVSADFVYLFILFGALLEAAGGGALLIALARRLAGRSPGGPAKTAALASALMGSLSGSAVANVVTTGTITIPLMRRAGFPPHLAAAVEAAASTGGQLMPPVMGAGAFILATWTGIPYVKVATAALLPAVLYYVALLTAIHLAARRRGISPMQGDETLQPGSWMLLAPLVIVIALLAVGRSPMRAALGGVLSSLAIGLLTRRIDPRKLLDTLVAAAGGAVQVAAACATAGIVVGVATLTGIGLRMSELIVLLSGGLLPLALLLTALGSIVLGMGLPTTAAYVVLAALGAPALEQLGASTLSAHLFIFYFGCISNVTPPVSLAAYAAAGLAGAAPTRTALLAMGLASTGFLVPFAFVIDGGLLLQGSWTVILHHSATALVGVCALAAAVVGYHNRVLPPWERVALGAAAAALVIPGLLTDLVGSGVVLASWEAGRFRR